MGQGCSLLPCRRVRPWPLLQPRSLIAHLVAHSGQGLHSFRREIDDKKTIKVKSEKSKLGAVENTK
jgi:hypothetical protein